MMRRLILAACLTLALPSLASAQVSRVTGCGRVEDGVSTVQCDLVGAQIGDIIVGAVFQNESDDVGRTFSSVGDGGSSCTTQSANVEGFVDMRGFTCVVSTAGTKTIAVVFGGATNTTGIIADLVRGGDAVTPVRGYAIQAQTGLGTTTDSISSGSATAAVGDYVFGATAFPGSGQDVSPGTGYTQGFEHVQGASGDAIEPAFGEYRTATSASETATMTSGGDSNWKTMVLVVRAAAASGGTCTALLLGVGKC